MAEDNFRILGRQDLHATAQGQLSLHCSTNAAAAFFFVKSKLDGQSYLIITKALMRVMETKISTTHAKTYGWGQLFIRLIFGTEK